MQFNFVFGIYIIYIYILLSIAEKIDGAKFVGVASPDANVVVHSRDL